MSVGATRIEWGGWIEIGAVKSCGLKGFGLFSAIAPEGLVSGVRSEPGTGWVTNFGPDVRPSGYDSQGL